jgi:hypothetical protein
MTGEGRAEEGQRKEKRERRERRKGVGERRGTDKKGEKCRRYVASR